MKKITSSILLAILSFVLIAQAPQAFKYQTVVRDNTGNVMTNHNVSFRMSILQGSITGPSMYTEMHLLATNGQGLVNLEIGNGIQLSGDFSAINWGDDAYYLQVELDPNGLTNYQLMGTTQLLAVPYAMYSEATGDTTRWRKSGDDLYFNKGNIGIGTTLPTSALHVKGQATFENNDWNYLKIKSLDEGTDPSLQLYAGEDIWAIHNDDSWANDLNIRFNNDVKMTIDSNGYVGIGVTNPSSLLDINGATRFVVKLDSEGRSKVGNLTSSDDTLALVSYGNAEISIDENNNSSDKVFRVVHNENEELFRVQENGSVGIGTSSPASSAILEANSTEKGFLPPCMTEAQRDAISNPVAGLQIFNTSTNQPNYYNGSIWMNFDGTAAQPLAIGDYYQGGIVFYLDGNGGGLVCALSDQSSGAEWGCYGTSINGADGTAIGTGAQNTIDIEAGCITAGIAADICANLSLNGYDDWFLPSKDELNAMYQHKDAIDATALANGGSAFVITYYWSSSEYDSIYAWRQNFFNGGQVYHVKSLLLRVRAVRAF
ncbi:MAG: DUF1566 domain-containing protein [Bacteroidetes bacterium]|nr:DUF1566 domain-containing protein [Bacteroidota bacterium]